MRDTEQDRQTNRTPEEMTAKRSLVATAPCPAARRVDHELRNRQARMSNRAAPGWISAILHGAREVCWLPTT